MYIFQSSSSSQQPAEKRISLPASQRLTTITEGPNANLGAAETPPPIPRRSSRRNSQSSRHSRRWSAGSSADNILRVGPPPPYDWVEEPVDEKGDKANTAKDDKLAWLRRGKSEDGKRRRGGWVRLALIIGLILLLVIALAVGLGVGLSQKHKKTDVTKHKDKSGGSGGNGSNGGQQTTTPSDSGSKPDSDPPQKFPLGTYSLVTALMTLEASCTANPATWRCYPDTVYSVSTTESSMAYFNWIVSNTSSTYADSSTASTDDKGVPANLTVSTTDNPFDISFSDKDLTYISASDDPDSARYTFSFTMPKQVDSLIALTQDNADTTCFYNQTAFTGTMYLSLDRTYPTGSDVSSTSLGGYEQWPYAVEITQTAYGGTDVPNCYKTLNGQLGDRITESLDPQSSDSECLCDYKNY